MRPALGFLIILFFILLTNCKDQQTNSKPEKEPTGNLDREIEMDSMPSVQLSQKANQELNDWPEFMTVKMEIDKLTEMSRQDVINNAGTLNEAVNRMTDSVPNKFKNSAVMGRLKVMKTKTSIFKQQIRNRNYSGESVTNSAEDIYGALLNLETQLNEIYLKPLKDIEAEMKKAVNDSTMQEYGENEKPKR